MAIHNNIDIGMLRLNHTLLMRLGISCYFDSLLVDRVVRREIWYVTGVVGNWTEELCA